MADADRSLASASDATAPPADARPTRPVRAGRSLRWQLGVSYMRVTFFAVLALELAMLLLAAQTVLVSASRVQVDVEATLEPIVGRLLASDASVDALEAYLDRPVPGRDAEGSIAFAMPHPPQGWTVIATLDGALWYDNREAAGDPLDRNARRLLNAAQESVAPRTARGLVRALRATPIETPDGRTVGTLLQVSGLPPTGPGLAALAVAGLLLATVAVVSLGTVFGLLASRPLTRRIRRLSDAADAWSRGDLTRRVDDDGDDELGRLSERLERMAREVDELLQSRQLLATSEERTRIARELHDSVKQQLFAASMRLGAARIVPPGEADGQLEAVARLLDEAKNELAHLIHELRPVAIEGRALEDALRSFVARHGGDAGPRIDLAVEPGVRASPDVGAALYRIVQESVSNAVRHAAPSHVGIRVGPRGRSIEVRVEDDGRGFDPSLAKNGVGLASMRERALRVGGTLDVAPGTQGGTRVRALLPAEGHEPPGTTSRAATKGDEEDA